ncbi:Serine/threonine-protein kinase BLUS1 [Forsythia ovata]|uniref:Serine/threonine-protein kinase BLUS1 n=1 Tax=Forsythia ovata TaxID=205694 RepID=A0ABD1VGW8_9LAMI
MAPQNFVGKTTGDEYLILKKFRLDCNNLDEEIGRSIFSSTPNAQNVVEFKRNFYSHHRFSCASMAIMSECSLRDIISKQFTYGLPEDCIAIALRETLYRLSFLHGRGHVHRKIDAGHIFVNRASTGATFKLGFQASTYEHDQEREMASTSTLPLRDISKWGSAPEIYRGEEEDYKPHSDIWLVGITALELGYGCFPVRDRVGFEAVIEEIIKKKKLPTMEKLKMIADEETVLEKKFKSMVRKGESEFSPEFEKVVVKCLSEKPEMRPTACASISVN